MTYVAGYYVPTPHRSQYDPDSSTSTRREGCGPTTVANGANASTGGKISKTGQQIHNLLPKYQETDPSTLGWSIPDQIKAAAKIGVPMENRSGQGWSALLTALNHGLYVALQGDSDRFGNSTCSGDFDGDHDIGVSPSTRLVSGLRQHWINDPICPSGRWEYDYVIRSYAVKLSATIRFAIFTHPVPKYAAPAPVTVTLRYGGVKIARTVKKISVPTGQKANVRYRPTTAASIATRLANGQTFTAYQRTSTGQLLAGSRVWFGNATGTRWLHITAF